MVRSRRLGPLVLGVLLLVGPPIGSRAQEADPAEAPKPAAAKAEGSAKVRTKAKAGKTAAPTAKTGVGRGSIVELVRNANPMLWPLALCSVVALGYALERLIALRRGRVIPEDF